MYIQCNYIASYIISLQGLITPKVGLLDDIVVQPGSPLHFFNCPLASGFQEHNILPPILLWKWKMILVERGRKHDCHIDIPCVYFA